MGADMELRVVDTTGVPAGSLVSIRVGSTRRQATLGSEKPYRFNDICGKQQMKVDVYALVAQARLLIDPSDAKLSLPLEPPPLRGDELGATAVLYPGGTGHIGVDLEIAAGIQDQLGTDSTAAGRDDAAARPISAMSEKSSASRRHQVALEAQPYFEEHGVVELLQTILQGVLKDKPLDPYSYMIRVLENSSLAAASKLNASKSSGAQPRPQTAGPAFAGAGHQAHQPRDVEPDPSGAWPKQHGIEPTPAVASVVPQNVGPAPIDPRHAQQSVRSPHVDASVAHQSACSSAPSVFQRPQSAGPAPTGFGQRPLSAGPAGASQRPLSAGSVPAGACHRPLNAGPAPAAVRQRPRSPGPGSVRGCSRPQSAGPARVGIQRQRSSSRLNRPQSAGSALAPVPEATAVAAPEDRRRCMANRLHDEYLDVSPLEPLRPLAEVFEDDGCVTPSGLPDGYLDVSPLDPPPPAGEALELARAESTPWSPPANNDDSAATEWRAEQGPVFAGGLAMHGPASEEELEVAKDSAAEALTSALSPSETDDQSTGTDARAGDIAFSAEGDIKPVIADDGGAEANHHLEVAVQEVAAQEVLQAHAAEQLENAKMLAAEADALGFAAGLRHSAQAVPEAAATHDADSECTVVPRISEGGCISAEADIAELAVFEVSEGLFQSLQSGTEDLMERARRDISEKLAEALGTGELESVVERICKQNQEQLGHAQEAARQRVRDVLVTKAYTGQLAQLCAEMMPDAGAATHAAESSDAASAPLEAPRPPAIDGGDGPPPPSVQDLVLLFRDELSKAAMTGELPEMLEKAIAEDCLVNDSAAADGTGEAPPPDRSEADVAVATPESEREEVERLRRRLRDALSQAASVGTLPAMLSQAEALIKQCLGGGPAAEEHHEPTHKVEADMPAGPLLPPLDMSRRRLPPLEAPPALEVASPAGPKAPADEATAVDASSFDAGAAILVPSSSATALPAGSLLSDAKASVPVDQCDAAAATTAGGDSWQPAKVVEEVESLRMETAALKTRTEQMESMIEKLLADNKSLREVMASQLGESLR